jgi:hypothetical protein
MIIVHDCLLNIITEIKLSRIHNATY